MKNPFKLISSKLIYQNPWIKVREDSVKRPDGEDGIFGVVEMVDGSTVIAINDSGEVALVNEYAYAFGKESLELVSGAIDIGETPLEAAKRELYEEVGGKSDEWVDLGKINPFTTVIDSTNHMFFAKNTKFDSLHNGDAGEPIEIIFKPFDEVLDMVIKGDIVHGASCVAILKVARLLGK